MQPVSVCFASPISVPLRPTFRVSAKRKTVCVLSQESSPNKVPVKVEKASRFYKVLPSTLPVQDRPELPPVHWNLPFIGFLADHWIGNTPPVLASKYGSIYKSSLLNEKVNIVTDMDAIIDIQKNPDVFTSKGSFGALEATLGENSMLLLDGLDHSVIRQAVAPAFSPTVFPFLFDSICTRTEKTWATVHRNVEESGKDLLDPVFRRHYLEIAVEITTGIDMDSDMASTLFSRFFRLNNAFFSPQVGPVWESGVQARAEIISILENLIKRTLSEKKDTIDKLREYGDKLSFKSTKDIKKGDVNVMMVAIATSKLQTGEGTKNDPAEVHTMADLMLLLWFAGYVTSAATTSCAAFEMGLDGDIWASLAAEQDALVRAAGDRAVTYEQAASQMPLLDSFITEMLRMHPATQGAHRVATVDVSILGKYVRADEKLFVDYTAAMRDPRKYPDPDTLKIDRFVAKEGATPPPRVLAFGAPGSPHYCIGAALAKILMRTTIAVLLREYTMTLDPRQSTKYAVIPDDTPRSKVVVTGMTKRN